MAAAARRVRPGTLRRSASAPMRPCMSAPVARLRCRRSTERARRRGPRRLTRGSPRASRLRQREAVLTCTPMPQGGPAAESGPARAARQSAQPFAAALTRPPWPASLAALTTRSPVHPAPEQPAGHAQDPLRRLHPPAAAARSPGAASPSPPRSCLSPRRHRRPSPRLAATSPRSAPPEPGAAGVWK